MGIQTIPAAAAGGGGVTAFAQTLAAMQTTYESIQAFEAGVYTATVVPSSTNAQLTFVSGSAVITTQNTASGVVQFQLSSAATKIYITGKSGGTAGAVVTVEKTAEVLTPDDIGNGTLDTINATGTYNQTGLMAVLAFGGGESGLNGNVANYSSAAGTGGNSGGIAYGMVYTNTATTVTVGAAGIAKVSNNTNRVLANASSFGNLLTTSTNHFLYNATGGNVNAAGNASFIFPSFNGNSTTGGGGGGSGWYGRTNTEQPGGGSGIGTGGTSANVSGNQGNQTRSNVAATAGTGKASGGGGGTSVSGNGASDVGIWGADGAPGVVYVLRGF